MKKDEKIGGLDLADYKSIEAEALQQITSANKILMVSEAILAESRNTIKLLGGMTSDEELKKG